jgi:hypothetical protein
MRAIAASVGVLFAAVACTRPADLSGTPASVAAHRLWSGEDVDFLTGDIAPDGRVLSDINWTSGDLGLVDLATGTIRDATGEGYGAGRYAWTSAFSSDGTRVAVSWFVEAASSHELRVMSRDGSDSRVLVPTSPTLYAIDPLDWSSSDDAILVAVQTRDRLWQIGLVSVETGRCGSCGRWAGRRLEADTRKGIPRRTCHPTGGSSPTTIRRIWGSAAGISTSSPSPTDLSARSSRARAPIGCWDGFPTVAASCSTAIGRERRASGASPFSTAVRQERRNSYARTCAGSSRWDSRETATPTAWTPRPSACTRPRLIPTPAGCRNRRPRWMTTSPARAWRPTGRRTDAGWRTWCRIRGRIRPRRW